MSTDPAPSKADPLGWVVVGDPDPTLDRPGLHCSQTRSLADLGPVWCTRSPHPNRWRHIAGDERRVIAVWTDEPQPGSAD